MSKRLGWSALLGVTALAVLNYSPVLRGGYFIDDWELLLANPGQDILGAFWRLHPYFFYRPIQLSIVALLQSTVGPSTVPIHIIQIIILVALALLVARVCTELGASRWGALAGASFVVCSQGAVSGAAGIDTISQTLGTLAGAAACWWLYAALRRGERPVLWPALVLFGVALLSKESSIGYLPILALLAYRSSPLRAASFVILAAVYWIWRAKLGGSLPALGAGMYDMRLGSNLIVHPIMLWFAALLPISTVRVFTGVAQHAWLWPAIGGLGVLLVLALVVWGLKQRGKLGWGLAWGIAATVTLAPVLPLTHVSELYAFSLVPFIGVAIGLATDSLRSHRWVAACVVLILISNAIATRSKAASMAENGRTAASLTTQLVSRLRDLRPNTEVVLADVPAPEPDYSVFRVGGFKLVEDRTLLRLSGRPDLTIRRIASSDSIPVSGKSAVYTLDPTRTQVRVVTSPG